MAETPDKSARGNAGLGYFLIGISILITLAEPRLAFTAGLPLLLLGAYLSHKLILTILLASLGGFFAGLVTGNTWLVAASALSMIAGGAWWVIRSRFGEKDAPGENRPRPLPGTS